MVRVHTLRIYFEPTLYFLGMEIYFAHESLVLYLPSLVCDILCIIWEMQTPKKGNTMENLLFKFIVYIKCCHLIKKGPQSFWRHLYFMKQKDSN
jgi:hypothetical protein